MNHAALPIITPTSSDTAALVESSREAVAAAPKIAAHETMVSGLDAVATSPVR